MSGAVKQDAHPLMEFDRLLADEMQRTENDIILCGVDEAGRGPLAGPVFAAAVILPPGLALDGLDDSKKLSEKKREMLYSLIVDGAVVELIPLSRNSRTTSSVALRNCCTDMLAAQVVHAAVPLTRYCIAVVVFTIMVIGVYVRTGASRSEPITKLLIWEAGAVAVALILNSTVLPPYRFISANDMLVPVTSCHAPLSILYSIAVLIPVMVSLA